MEVVEAEIIRLGGAEARLIGKMPRFYYKLGRKVVAQEKAQIFQFVFLSQGMSIPRLITPSARSQETAFYTTLILMPAGYLITLEQSRVQALRMQQALDNSKPIKLKATKQK